MKRYCMESMVVAVVLSAVFFVMPSGVHAQQAEGVSQEEMAPADALPVEDTQGMEDEVNFSWGRVMAISDTAVTITEYNYEADKEEQITYTIDANAVLENVDAISAISVGQTVDISYVVKDAARIVIALALDIPEEEQPIVEDDSEGMGGEEIDGDEAPLDEGAGIPLEEVAPVPSEAAPAEVPAQ